MFEQHFGNPSVSPKVQPLRTSPQDHALQPSGRIALVVSSVMEGTAGQVGHPEEHGRARPLARGLLLVVGTSPLG